MHPVQYTVLDYAYRADYSCTVTMHVQKIQKDKALTFSLSLSSRNSYQLASRAKLRVMRLKKLVLA